MTAEPVCYTPSSICAALQLGTVELVCNVCGNIHCLTYHPTYAYYYAHYLERLDRCADAILAAGAKAASRIVDLRRLRQAARLCRNACALASRMVVTADRPHRDLSCFADYVYDATAPNIDSRHPHPLLSASLIADLPIHWTLALPKRDAESAVALMILYRMLHSWSWREAEYNASVVKMSQPVGSMRLWSREARLCRAISHASATALAFIEEASKCRTVVDRLCIDAGLDAPYIQADGMPILLMRKILI